jgi:iron complex outermembrane receptor protein
MLANGLKGRTWGLEAWGNVQLRPSWRLFWGATRLWKDFEMKSGRTDLAREAALGDDPKWQVKAGTQADLTRGVQFALDARWVSKIETAPRIPAYAEASARLGWAVNDTLELYVAGRNLLHKSHIESNDLNQGLSLHWHASWRWRASRLKRQRPKRQSRPRSSLNSRAT